MARMSGHPNLWTIPPSGGHYRTKAGLSRTHPGPQGVTLYDAHSFESKQDKECSDPENFFLTKAMKVKSLAGS